MPRETVCESYALEYGTNEVHIHADSIKQGQKVIIVDDLLATGGTVEATIKFTSPLQLCVMIFNYTIFIH